MKNLLSGWIILISIGVVWRCLWLASGLPSTTLDPDGIRRQLSLVECKPPLDQFDVQWAIVESSVPPKTVNSSSWQELLEPSGLQVLQVDRWDPQSPVWLSPGGDGQPGWANLDDNLNGSTDEAAELGAAWSDDFCVTAMNTETTHSPTKLRQIDSGAFVRHELDVTELPPQTKRLRITLSIGQRLK